MNVYAAGSFFTNGTHVLAGFQPYKERPVISGIGGKCLPGEIPFTTVIRETVEELFNVNEIRDEVISELSEIIPQNIIIHNNYYIHVYSFTDLECMLAILCNHRIISPIYESLPKNVYDLITNRKVLTNENYVEISHLTLLPLIYYNIDENVCIIDKYFIQDINYYLSLMNKTHEAPCPQPNHAIS